MLALATVAVEGILLNLRRYTKECDPGLRADRSYPACAWRDVEPFALQPHPELSSENSGDSLVMVVPTDPRFRGHPCAAIPFTGAGPLGVHPLGTQ